MKNQETRMKRNEYSIKKILACTFILIDSDDYDEELNSHPIEVTDSEIEAVYGVEEQKRDLAVFFDESREKDDTWPEYVQALPKSLDNKINEVYF